MAEGWIRYYGVNDVTVFSAGIESHGLNDMAVRVMAEAMIDISGQESKTVSELPDVVFDYIITVCDNAKENCPFLYSRFLDSSSDANRSRMWSDIPV